MAKAKADMRNLPIPDKIQKVGTVATKLTGNASFPKAQPMLAGFKAANSALQVAYTAAQGARQTAKQLTDIQDAKEALLDTAIAAMVADVNAESGGDSVKILSSGFELAKAAAPAGIPGAVTDFSLTRGDNPGEIDGHCHSVPNARSYESQAFSGPMPTGPFVANKSFFKSKFEWTGFTSGDKIWIQVRAVGTAGEGPWSDAASLIAP